MAAGLDGNARGFADGGLVVDNQDTHCGGSVFRG